jgi:hypothetical protein
MALLLLLRQGIEGRERRMGTLGGRAEGSLERRGRWWKVAKSGEMTEFEIAST